MKKSLLKYLIILLSISCSDASQISINENKNNRILGDMQTDNSLDAFIIDWKQIDSYLNPCQSITSSSENFCNCKPECCQTQMWYCPPNGLGVSAAEIVMNICDDDFRVCDRARDLTCSPNEVLSRSDCNTVLECPPGIENDITITVQCEIEGVQGEQEILCTKGDISYGECVICEPEEERCNYLDDDCDGEIDENQRNVCGACGPVPAESCDNIDNNCDGETDEDLIRECNTLCERGFEVCQAGSWISCTARRPIEENCDGADNDCDGRVDEELECLCSQEDVGILVPCTEPPLLCGQGFKTCECADESCIEYIMTPCTALCNHIPTPPGQICDINIGMIVQQEECNNFDEDCDQLVDENLIQDCYTGNPDLLFTGVCVPGSAICQTGAWGNELNGVFQIGVCLDEVLPSPEICDGSDNDCDGEVDYGDNIRDTDILFIIDWSGSMDEEIEAVRISLARFAQQFAAENVLQWGLIIGPKESIRNVESLIRVKNISPFEQFLAAFAALGNEGMDTGKEMLKDAIYFSIESITANRTVDVAAANWPFQVNSSPIKERFSISWRNNAQRIIIVFSDEEPQSFLQPNITDAKLIEALRGTIDFKLYVFVPEDRDGDEWEDIILAGRGDRFRLTSNAVNMYNDLMTIIDDACLPRENQMGMIRLKRNKKESKSFYVKFVSFIEKIFPR